MWDQSTVAERHKRSLLGPQQPLNNRQQIEKSWKVIKMFCKSIPIRANPKKIWSSKAMFSCSDHFQQWVPWQKAMVPTPCDLRAHKKGLLPRLSVHLQNSIQNLLPRLLWSVLPIWGRLWEFVDEGMGITQDPFMLGMVQGHLLLFDQKPLLVKPSHKCEVKIQKIKKLQHPQISTQYCLKGQ